VKSNKGFAEMVFVEQVQVISPRAIKVVHAAAPRHETFKDAKGFWLNMVIMGLLLLGGASALAVGGVKHDAGGAMLLKLKLGFVVGPGGPKLGILSDLLRAPTTMPWALGSLMAYAGGVLALMWPEHVGIMGLGGIGRLIACLMAAAALIFGVDLVRGQPLLTRIIKIDYDEILTWLIFLDMVAMILVNMRIAGIAGRGGYHGLAKLAGGMMTLQVSGVLILLFALNVSHQGIGLMRASAGAFAAGGVGMSVIGLFLILRIGWEVIRRRVSIIPREKGSDEDWK